MARYEQKTVLITGGTSGIGLAAAKLLQAEGARVLVTGRSAASLESARAELGDAAVVRSDVTDAGDVDELVTRVRADLGHLDMVFLNAGITAFVPVDEVTEDLYDRMFDTNVKAAYFLVQKIAPVVADGGALVLTTSVANVLGLPRNSVYAASKAAVRSLVRSFAQELLPRGIRVNAVSPGPIDTGILDKTLSADAARETYEQMEEQNPMGRFGDPAEVAAAAAFLGFDATYTTGAELPVDGGGTQM